MVRGYSRISERPLASQAAARADGGGMTESYSPYLDRIGHVTSLAASDAAVGELDEPDASGDLVAPGRAGNRRVAGSGLLGGHARDSPGGPATVGSMTGGQAASLGGEVRAIAAGEAPAHRRSALRDQVTGGWRRRPRRGSGRTPRRCFGALGGHVEAWPPDQDEPQRTMPIGIDPVEAAGELHRGAVDPGGVAVARRAAAARRRTPRSRGSRRAAHRARLPRRPRRTGAGPSPWFRPCRGAMTTQGRPSGPANCVALAGEVPGGAGSPAC